MSEARVDQGEFYERQIPAVPAAALGLALVVLLIGIGIWEYSMRGLGLETWDLDDGPGHWAVERRRVDAGGVDVAIIGASRILFDTDLDVFEEVTGIRPVQLALAGTVARSFLTDLADDEDFNGLLIIGMTELVYFLPPEGGLFEGALSFYRDETPSERFGHQVYLRLQGLFAFIDSEYTLTRLISRLPMPRREGTFDPYDEVWKLKTNEADRQTRLWHRIESPGPLLEHARHAWVADWEYFKPISLEGFAPDAINEAIATTYRDIEKIRARGGEVVFVRCPSSDFYQDIEREYLPRARIYDRLIAETYTLGLHFEDYESMRGLIPPEWSHLSATDAKVFTRAYALELVKQSAWLQARMAERNEPGE
jgi:hypothetical protein